MAKNKTGNKVGRDRRARREIAQSVEAARLRALSSIPEEAAAALLPDGSGFQEVTLATIVVLEEIKSPFINKNVSQDTPLMDVTRALFVLSSPIEQVENVLSRSKASASSASFKSAKSGPRESADLLKLFDNEVRIFARKIPLSVLNGLAEKIDAHIARSMNTAIPHGEGGDAEDTELPLEGSPANPPGSDGTSSTTTS